MQPLITLCWWVAAFCLVPIVGIAILGYWKQFWIIVGILGCFVVLYFGQLLYRIDRMDQQNYPQKKFHYWTKRIQ
ncbi:MAG TPA: hypothetical protein VFO40_04885 [Chthoniobacterales bacterium]|nr:hypothetical protein [Chthoniobacterales bacterium]